MENLNATATPMMSFMDAIKTCFQKYANFNGRARRSEFWWFYLLNCIPGWIISGLAQWKMSKAAELEAQIYDSLFDQSKQAAIMEQAESVDAIFFPCAIIFGIISLAMLIPMLAAWVRRLHDIGKSGHMLWLILVCGIGGLIPLLMCIKDGDPAPNQYGESPKYVA